MNQSTTQAPSGRPTPPSPPQQAQAPTGQQPKRVVQPREQKALAPKLVLNAVEGWGKTSLAAYAPSPLILMAPRETGYDTLLSGGRVPQIPAVEVTSWADLLGWIDSLVEDPQGVQTLALDAGGGFERLCHEMVCARDFQNNWGERGFMGFMRGYEVSIADWLGMLSRLERLNHQHGITILLLGHAKIETVKNPMGPDYDTFTSDVHKKTWAATCKWADAVLFGKFHTIVEGAKGDPTKKGKGIGGTDRIVYAEQRDAYTAKNRFGMPPEFLLPNDPAHNWATMWQAITNPQAFAQQ